MNGRAVAASSYILHDQHLMAGAKNYFEWQCRLVTRELGQRVLEVGSGIGNFTGKLLDREAVMALDVEEDCIERLKSRYADQSNLYAFCCDWGAPDWDRQVLPRIARFHPDSCVCLNVLEHFEDDREALLRMARVLRPGGVIVLLVPAFPALFGPIDELLGHHRRYTRSSIRQVADSAGLQIADMHYVNATGFFGWWANAHLFRRTVQSESQIGFFDQFIVPLSSRLESLVKPPFGQSLLAVLRKP
jgi:SAM-dependent methyltransferase